MMKKYSKYILLTIGGILVYNILKAGSMANKFAKFKSAEALKLLALQTSLQKAGLTGDSLNFALAQLLFETGRFTKASQVAAANNNYSGIKWINKAYQIATKGTPVPPGEKPASPTSPLNWYAHFADMDGWAKDFVRIISFGAKPKNALTPEDYVTRLKKNNYFGGSESVYLKNLKIYLAMFQ